MVVVWLRMGLVVRWFGGEVRGVVVMGGLKCVSAYITDHRNSDKPSVEKRCFMILSSTIDIRDSYHELPSYRILLETYFGGYPGYS